MQFLSNSFRNKIILFTLIIVGSKWIISFAYFPHEDLSLRIISEAMTKGYFHYVKVLSDLDFVRNYSPNLDSKEWLMVPIGSVIFHSIFFKIMGISSFILLEFICVFIFLFSISSIVKEFRFNKNFPIFIALLFFSIPILINLFGVKYTYLITISNSFYNLQFPRPLVANLYLFFFLYFVVKNYKEEILTKKNIYFLSVFFGLLASSSFFIFISLFIFLITVIFLKYSFTSIIEKIKILNKDVLISIIISLILIAVFFLTILKSNNDYSMRLGIFPINIDKKIWLLKYYLLNLVKVKNLLAFLLATFIFIFLNNRSFEEKYIIKIFFINLICSLFTPFIFILLFNKVAFLYHFNNLILINLVLFYSFVLISLYQLIIDKIKIFNLNTGVIYLFVILLLISNLFFYLNKENLSKNNDNRKFTNKAIEFIKYEVPKNCEILAFDHTMQTWLIMNGYKYFQYIDGTFTSRNNEVIENDLINAMKITNMNEKDLIVFLKSEFDGWRFKNHRLQQLFWQTYTANSFYTYNDSLNFEEEEKKIIINTSPFYVHQIVMPIEIKKILINKFNNYDIKEIKLPDLIIIKNSDSFWSKSKINTEKFKLAMSNSSYELYLNINSYKNKCAK